MNELERYEAEPFDYELYLRPEDCRDYDPRDGLQPITQRGTVLIDRRFRPQARARVPWGRPRVRGSELKEAA